MQLSSLQRNQVPVIRPKRWHRNYSHGYQHHARLQLSSVRHTVSLTVCTHTYLPNGCVFALLCLPALSQSNMLQNQNNNTLHGIKCKREWHILRQQVGTEKAQQQHLHTEVSLCSLAHQQKSVTCPGKAAGRTAAGSAASVVAASCKRNRHPVWEWGISLPVLALWVPSLATGHIHSQCKPTDGPANRYNVLLTLFCCVKIERS